MTDIPRAKVELMRIVRSLTFVDPATSRRIELVVESYLGGDEARGIALCEAEGID